MHAFRSLRFANMCSALLFATPQSHAHHADSHLQDGLPAMNARHSDLLYRAAMDDALFTPVTAMGTRITGRGNRGSICFEVIGPERRYDASSVESPNVLSPQHYAIDLILKPVLDQAGDWPTDRYMAERTRLLSDVRMRVVEPPRHGKLLPVENGMGGAYFYLADRGYFGTDRITFSITFYPGPTVLLNTAISVTDSPSDEKHTGPCLITPAEYRQMRRDHKEIEELWKERQRAWNGQRSSIRDRSHIVS